MQSFLNANRTIFISLILIFFTSAASIIAGIYSNTLFLSTYPRTWLIYLLATQATVIILISIALMPLLVKNIKRNSLIILSGLFLITNLLIVIHYSSFYWMAFFTAIVMGVISAFLSAIAWNVIPLAFGLRQYKEVARHAGQASAAGGIIGSFLVPLQLKFLPLESLLYLIVIFILIIMPSVFLLPLIDQSGERKIEKKKISPLNYPLYQTFIIFMMGIIASQALIDYAFKFEVASYYTGQALGSFMGYFSGITNILGLILGLTTIKYVHKLFHLDGILYATPVFTFLCCLCVIFMPSLWTVCILASTRALFYFNYTIFSTEIILNILPSVIRIAGKLQLKTIISPICTAVVFILLMLVAKYLTIRDISIVVAIIAIVCISLVKRLNLFYKNTLQEEIKFRHFNVIDQETMSDPSVFRYIAEHALKSTDSSIVLLGLAMIEKINDNSLPAAIYQQLNNPKFLVRKFIIETIKKRPHKNSIQPLIERLSLETDVEIKFLILDALASLAPDTAIEMARNIIHDRSADCYPAAINVLIQCGKPTEQAEAITAINSLVQSEHFYVRKEAANIIGNLHLIRFENELGSLITDENIFVSRAAIIAAANCDLVNLTPKILRRLKNAPILHIIISAINKFGAQAIPYIILAFSDNKKRLLLMKVLASLPGDQHEQAVLAIAKSSDIFYRAMLAKEVSFYACNQAVSEAFKMSVKELALKEILYIEYLQQLILTVESPVIIAEINARIQLVKMCILYWVAVATDPRQINKLIPSLLNSSQDFLYLQAQQKAIELLEFYIKDRELLSRIIALFEPVVEIKNSQSFDMVYHDKWLEQVFASQIEPSKGENMDLLSKVFDLRGVELFKDLPSEVLVSIAEEAQRVSYNEGDIIFQEGDVATGLYCISSGSVRVELHGEIFNILARHAYFGELALIDDSVRTASVIAETDCSLLLLSKETFDRITDDLPEVLRVVTKVILHYLRQRLAKEHT